MPKALLSTGLGVVIFLAVAVPVAADQLAGYGTPQQGDPPLRSTDLFKGDLIPEMGIGCMPTSDSGGPNDVAQGVTAHIAPPFNITSHFYHIFTYGVFITALTFAIGDPGLTQWVPVQSGLNWGKGPQVVAIDPPVQINNFQFFFGQIQPQTNAGMRWGLDTNSGSAGLSYIRAPACGVSAFTLLDDLGFPGNWIMSVTVEQPVSVELTDFEPSSSRTVISPNPADGPCQISFHVPFEGPVSVELLHVSGRLVRQLMAGQRPAGEYHLEWDGRDDHGREVPAGVYLTRVETVDGVTTGRVVLAR
jgi:hypothetical protein